MPAEVKEIKQFLEYARRKDARQVTIKKTSARKAGSTATVQKYKFKLRCSRYLYTFQLADADKAEKLRQSLPPTLKVNDVDAVAPKKK
ncbi:hypothetical protein JCM11251_002859 [Rhodosporidiobolus azoricus]